VWIGYYWWTSTKGRCYPNSFRTQELSKSNTTVSLRYAVYFGHKSSRGHEFNKVYLRSLKCSVNNTTPLIDGIVYFIWRVLTHTPASFEIFKIRLPRTEHLLLYVLPKTWLTCSEHVSGQKYARMYMSIHSRYVDFLAWELVGIKFLRIWVYEYQAGNIANMNSTNRHGVTRHKQSSIITSTFLWPVLHKLLFSVSIQSQQEATKHLKHLFLKCPHHVSFGWSHERGRYRWGSGKYAEDKIAVRGFGVKPGGKRPIVKSRVRWRILK